MTRDDTGKLTEGGGGAARGGYCALIEFRRGDTQVCVCVSEP